MSRPKQSAVEIATMRERILDAAFALLTAQGPQTLSVRAIAEQVGVSHMTLYTYFENRDAIFRALRERQRGKKCKRRAAQLREAQSGDPCAVMREVLASYGQLAEEHPRLYQFLWVHTDAHATQHHKEHRFACNLNHLAALIEIGTERGFFRQLAPDLAAAIVFSFVNGPLILYHSGHLQDRERLRAIEAEALATALTYLKKKEY